MGMLHHMLRKGGVHWRGWVDLLGGILEDASGEDLLLFEVADDLTEEINSDSGMIVGEAETSDLGAIDGVGVVVEEFFVEIRSERRIRNAVFLEEIRPGLQVVIVSSISDHLDGDGGDDAGLDGAHKVVLDAEELGDHARDRSLVAIAAIRQVVHFLFGRLGGHSVERLDDVTHVHSVQAETLIPEHFHLLVQLLIDGAHDQTRSHTLLVARAIDNSGTHNVVGHTRSSNSLLSAQRSLRQGGPGLDLRTFIRRLLYSTIRPSICDALSLSVWCLSQSST